MLRWSISQLSPRIDLRFRERFVELGQILEAPGNKFFSSTYGDFVLPEARYLRRFITKVVNNHNLEIGIKLSLSL